MMKYRPEVDGLRAVAVIPVVLYHAGLPGFSGGFTGVDVFFVISGYLITSIILAERGEGRFSIVDFYKRRMRRIFPALFTMLAVSFAAAFVLLPPSEMADFSRSLIASTFFYSNHYFLDASGYFATAAELTPLLHTWSLAVEEQFYAVFPLLLLASWRLGARRQLLLMAVVALVSLVIAQALVVSSPATAFFILPSRFWELLLGAIAAFLLAPGSTLAVPRLPGLSWLGLGLILAAVFGLSSATPFPGLAALLPTLGAFLVILFAGEGRGAGRILALRPATGVGLLSYSLYLWHYPVIALMRHLPQGGEPAALATAVAIAVAAAWLSYRHVEVPLRRTAQLRTATVYAASGVAMACLLGLGWAGTATQGFKSFYIAHRLDDAARRNYERFAASTLRGEAMTAGADDGACVFRADGLDDAFTARFDACARRHGKAVVLIGDSHAINLHNALVDAGVRPFFVSVAKGGCRPYQQREGCSYARFLTFAGQRQGDIGEIIFHMSGAHFVRDHLGRDDNQAAYLPGNSWSLAEDDIARVAAYLDSMPGSIKLVWLGPYAEARLDLNEPRNFSPERLRFNPQSLDIFARLDERLKQLAPAHRRFRYVSAQDMLRFDGNALLQGDCLTFQDHDHFSACGEALFGPILARGLGLT